jgi:hypothetical protein
VVGDLELMILQQKIIFVFKRNVLELNKRERGHNRRDHNTGQEVYDNNKKSTS